MKRWLPLLLGLVLAAPALPAASYRATVSHVSDGDTVWVRPATGGRPVPVRLLDIDAPESCQRFGPEARAALARRLLRQKVRVRSRGVDDYGRQLARLAWRGQDVGGWLVREGYAWSASFKGRPGPYAALQAQAQRQRRGLWALPQPLAPRSFRQRFGRCH